MRNSCPDLNTAHFFDTLVATSNIAFDVAEKYINPPEDDVSILKTEVQKKIAEQVATQLTANDDFKEQVTAKMEELAEDVDELFEDL